MEAEERHPVVCWPADVRQLIERRYARRRVPRSWLADIAGPFCVFPRQSDTCVLVTSERLRCQASSLFCLPAMCWRDWNAYSLRVMIPEYERRALIEEVYGQETARKRK